MSLPSRRFGERHPVTPTSMIYGRVGHALVARKVGKARAIVERAISKRGRDWRLWSLRASIEEFDGRFRLAEQYQQHAVMLARSKVLPLIELVELYRDTGQIRKARRTLSLLARALKSGVGPGTRMIRHEVLVMRSELELLGGRPRKAVRLLAGALRDAPGSRCLVGGMAMVASAIIHRPGNAKGTARRRGSR